jgi:ABC-type dipeptide/oligopeptide/nickel transport system permease subunit
MAQQHAERTHHHFTLNTDGRPHPLENTLTAVTFVLGVIAVATCGFHSLHPVATWTGLAGTLTGGYGQFVSATTAERFTLIIGLGMAALGFYIGMARGGFV